MSYWHIFFIGLVGFAAGFACKGLLSDRPKPDADESEHGVG